ncbi:beta-glucuronosyltransferase GlcAT14A [Tanacetum coccineum]
MRVHQRPNGFLKDRCFREYHKLILIVLSSGSIGTSFILKKKGLKKASTTTSFGDWLRRSEKRALEEMDKYAVATFENMRFFPEWEMELGSHLSTIRTLHAWETKLYDEVNVHIRSIDNNGSFVEYCIIGWENLPRALLLYYRIFVSSAEGYSQVVICNTQWNRKDNNSIVWLVRCKDAYALGCELRSAIMKLTRGISSLSLLLKIAWMSRLGITWGRRLWRRNIIVKSALRIFDGNFAI